MENTGTFTKGFFEGEPSKFAPSVNVLYLPIFQELVAKGVEMVACNIDSFDECLAAFKDAYGVFAMTNFWESGPDKEYEQGINMVKAAHQQGVQHFIWSSLPNTVAISHGKLDLPHYM